MPDDFVYDRATTGLLLVDVYNEWLSDGGRVWPCVQTVAELPGTLEHLRRLRAAAELPGSWCSTCPIAAGAQGDAEGWVDPARAHLGLATARLYPAGTLAGEFHPELAPAEGDVVCSEHWTENGMAHTNLDFLLRQHRIRDVILAGMTAPGCVEGTGREALEQGYAVTLVTDATAAYTDEMMHAAHAVNGPLNAAHILTTDEVLAALPEPLPVASG